MLFCTHDGRREKEKGVRFTIFPARSRLGAVPIMRRRRATGVSEGNSEHGDGPPTERPAPGAVRRELANVLAFAPGIPWGTARLEAHLRPGDAGDHESSVRT